MIKLFTKKRKGFTLIELIVVVAILGILAAIAIPRLSGSRETAAEAADKASIRTVESAISIAIADGALKLQTDNDGKATGFLNSTDQAVASTATGLATILVPKYLANMPASQKTTGNVIKVNWADGNYTVVFASGS